MAKPTKPKIRDVAENEKLVVGRKRDLTVRLNEGGGGRKNGGIVQVFSRNGRVALQKILTLPDSAGAGQDDKTIQFVPIRGHSHSIRVLVWDRSNGVSPLKHELSQQKVKFRTE